MKLYLTNMLFAEELFSYIHSNSRVIYKFETSWNPNLSILELNDKMDSGFSDEVGSSVMNIIVENFKHIEACFKEFATDSRVFKGNEIDAAYFAKCALDIAPMFFSKGYTHGAFFGYCSMVLGVAYHFMKLKPNGVPRLACQVIGLILFMHQMTAEFYDYRGWVGLRDTASNFNECLNKIFEM